MKTVDAVQSEEVMTVLALCVYTPTERKLARIAEQYNTDSTMHLYVEKKRGRIAGVIGIKMHRAHNYEIRQSL